MFAKKMSWGEKGGGDLLRGNTHDNCIMLTMLPRQLQARCGKYLLDICPAHGDRSKRFD